MRKFGVENVPQSDQRVEPLNQAYLLSYPHYYSTYCIHGIHKGCRLTCKTCKSPCLCACHKSASAIGKPEEGKWK